MCLSVRSCVCKWGACLGVEAKDTGVVPQVPPTLLSPLRWARSSAEIHSGSWACWSTRPGICPALPPQGWNASMLSLKQNRSMCSGDWALCSRFKDGLPLLPTTLFLNELPRCFPALLKMREACILPSYIAPPSNPSGSWCRPVSYRKGQ